jgi:hypothetical protein
MKHDNQEYRLSSGSKALLIVFSWVFISFGIVLMLKNKNYIYGSIISVISFAYLLISIKVKIFIDDKYIIFFSLLTKISIRIIAIKEIYIIPDFENTNLYALKYINENGKEKKRYFMKPERIDVLLASVKKLNNAVVIIQKK